MSLPSETNKPDLRIQGILSDIEKVKLEQITNKTYVDADVYLDGREFINCVFKNCRLFLKLGRFVIGGQRIHLEGCEFIASGPAATVRSIFEVLAHQPLPKKK